MKIFTLWSTENDEKVHPFITLMQQIQNFCIQKIDQNQIPFLKQEKNGEPNRTFCRIRKA